MIYHPIDINRYSDINIPEGMNNPLDYEPHPLCIMACKELQSYLAGREEWREEIDREKCLACSSWRSPTGSRNPLKTPNER